MDLDDTVLNHYRMVENGGIAEQGIEILVRPIDVWNVGTYDQELLAELECEADLIRRCIGWDNESYRLQELDGYRGSSPNNPHAYAFFQFEENVILPLMNERSIRGWHYTRLTDAEVALLRREGVYPSTLKSIKRRLDTLVGEGVLSVEQADALYAGSPFHHPQQGILRANQFWMTAQPLPVVDDGILSFLRSWGGESVFFWQENKDLKRAIAQIGRPRVIELAVPMRFTKHAYSAAKAIVAYYSQSIGCKPDKADFDFYTTRPLDPENVLAVHTEEDAGFKMLALGYPVEFVLID